MTHTKINKHYPVELTTDWLTSPEGRKQFADWLHGYAAPAVTESARSLVTDILPAAADAEQFDDWLLGNHPTVDAPFAVIYEEQADLWLGTNHEHDAFHYWADKQRCDTPSECNTLCGGCWS